MKSFACKICPGAPANNVIEYPEGSEILLIYSDSPELTDRAATLIEDSFSDAAVTTSARCTTDFDGRYSNCAIHTRQMLGSFKHIVTTKEGYEQICPSDIEEHPDYHIFERHNRLFMIIPDLNKINLLDMGALDDNLQRMLKHGKK